MPQSTTTASQRDCILCAQQAQFLAIAQCNHQNICYKCIYKMRIISKNNACPICKTQSKFIIITNQANRTFKSFTQSLICDKNYSDILYQNKQAQNAFTKLMEFKCFLKFGNKPCKNDKKFPSFAFLKKHLKQDHNRYLCDICFQKKTCVLEQQKLYSYQALTKHLQRGDIDQCGNVTFMHPYCKFCNKNFFDQEEFRLHINIDHMNCSVCGPLYKYIFYKNYQSLENHYKISHYICSQVQCVQKKFIAFRTAQQLKVHRAQMHGKSGGKKVDLKQMCGFTYEGHKNQQDLIQIKDKQGADMQTQFLSLKKTKNRALGQADQQNDSILDIRQFFQCDLDQEEHLEQAFTLKLSKKFVNVNANANANKQEQTDKQKKKKKYVSKTQIQKQKPTIAKQDQVFQLQDLKLLPRHQFSKMSFDQFENQLKRIMKDDDIQKFCEWRNKLNKNKLSAVQFVDNFFKLMKDISLKSAYHILPHFIRTIQNQQLQDEVDKQFLVKLKSLPSKSDSLLVSSKTYGNFFKTLHNEIQTNLATRIYQQTMSIKNPIKRNKQRLYQIIGVVRRLKIQEMAKFKFASNFGLQKDTMEYLIDKVFKLNKQNVQKRLSKITNEQIIDLYIFVKYCYLAIEHNKGMYLEKNKIHQNVLEDFLFERPELENSFGKKAHQMKTLQQKIQYENQMEQKRIKHQLKKIEVESKKRGYDIKTDYNLVDKGDFPQLDLIKQKEKQQKRQQNFKNVIEQSKARPATYQKKINQMFPTLGQDDDDAPSLNNKNSGKSNKSNENKKEQKKQKAWWQKLNQKSNNEDIQVANVKTKGKKKKVEWVQVKGLFN